MARSCERDVRNLKEALAVVAYASHDLTDADATDVFDATSIASDVDPHRFAMRWADSPGTKKVFAAIKGRFMIDTYDRRRVAADRFARILTRVRGLEPDAYRSMNVRDALADYAFGRLVDSEDDAAIACSMLDSFLESLDPSSLWDLLPEFGHEQSLILGSLLGHSRAAVDAAIAEEGPPGSGWSPFEIWRSLDIQTSLWRGRHAETGAVTSDETCAFHLARLPIVASVDLKDEKQSAALRLARLIASVAAIGDEHTRTPSAIVTASLRDHDAIGIREREDA